MISYDEDLEGNHYLTTEVTEYLAANCSLPVYGLYDSLLGHGIVGGSLASAESQGKLAGDLAIRVLNGERPEEIEIVGLSDGKMIFDARELSRCGLSEVDLPPDTIILNREPTFWEEFGQYVFLAWLRSRCRA